MKSPRGNPAAWPSLPSFGLRSLLPVLVVILSVAVLAKLLTAFWPHTLDDAFITFRYSENLASGRGPTFNPGERPAEGYTTFSWMLLMVIPHLLHLDVVHCAKIAGILSVLALALITFRLVARLTEFSAGRTRYLPAATSVLMLCALPATSIHAVSGMETAFYTMALTWFLERLTALTARGDTRTAWQVGLVGLLVGLTRPEGNLAVVVALSAAGACAPDLRWKTIIKAVVCTYVLPAAAYEVWRWHYYGLPFPLAFYVKVAGPGGLAGTGEVGGFLRFYGLRVGAFVLLGVLAMRRRFLPVPLAASSLLLFFLVPEHIMGDYWRFLFPVVPCILALAGTGLGAAQARIESLKLASNPRGRVLRAGLFLGLYLGALAWAGAGFLRGVGTTISVNRVYAEAMTNVHVAIGKQLGSVGPMTPTPLLAVADAGAIPYYSKWRVIDIFGLNDATIARSGRHDPQYVLGQKPDLVILNSKTGAKFSPRMPWVQHLYTACLERGMVVMQVMWLAEGRYYLWLMSDPGNPAMKQYVRKGLAGTVPAILVDVGCKSCGAVVNVQANLDPARPLQKGSAPFPADDKLACPACGAVIDLSELRRRIETETKKRIVPQDRR